MAYRHTISTILQNLQEAILIQVQAYDYDIAIVGAGPSGLCFAKALEQSGLRVVVLERQSEAALATPAFDGREIALTHHSASVMQQIGIWQHIPTDAISPLRDARVLNGDSCYAMEIDHRDSSKQALGYLVSNCLIRQAAYQAVQSASCVTLLTEIEITHVQTDADRATITLASGEVITVRLLVAADSRFSETRRMMGISASMHDFGRVMMVCAMDLEKPHEQVAWEWFDYGQTLAMLPMNDNRASIVVTMSAPEIQALMRLDEADFSRDITQRFQHRLGEMRLVSTRHAYPLVTVYPDRFVANRFAVIGDAAVGMHPVTAHGFNFGLRGAAHLASLIQEAQLSGKEIADTRLLGRYARAHRLATRPLFLATHMIAKLYSDDTPPAKLLRTASLHIGNHVTPFKRAVAQMLTESRSFHYLDKPS